MGKMGKPVLTDEEYDALRLQLKKEGSAVALHDSPMCSVETGVCKMDMVVDKGKTRLLYLPGWLGGMVLFLEGSCWTSCPSTSSASGSPRTSSPSRRSSPPARARS